MGIGTDLFKEEDQMGRLMKGRPTAEEELHKIPPQENLGALEQFSIRFGRSLFRFGVGISFLGILMSGLLALMVYRIEDNPFLWVTIIFIVSFIVFSVALKSHNKKYSQ